MDREFVNKIGVIVEAIRDAGYDPYAQLTGYIRTHDHRYITRSGNARVLIAELDMHKVKQYVSQMDQ